MTQPLLPDLPGFSIEQITLTDGVITVLAQSQAMRAGCPVCASLSSRVHSRYERTLADLPWSGRTVRLVVQVRRFFCLQPTCPRKTFAEAIPALAERSARRTIRLKEVLERLALALGGEQGSRLTAVLRMHCSPETLLRLLRRLPDEPFEPPRVVSLDDWAWRRGHRYGTLICDLERHRRLDVLPDREVASVAAWLKHYPSIEIMSRDRSDTYVTAARLGAPQVIQVTDKWHLLKNLGEALQRCLSPHLTAHRKQQTYQLLEASPVLQIKRPPRLSPLQEQAVQLHRAERLARDAQVIALRKQGLSHQAKALACGRRPQHGPALDRGKGPFPSGNGANRPANSILTSRSSVSAGKGAVTTEHASIENLRQKDTKDRMRVYGTWSSASGRGTVTLLCRVGHPFLHARLPGCFCADQKS